VLNKEQNRQKSGGSISDGIRGCITTGIPFVLAIRKSNIEACLTSNDAETGHVTCVVVYVSRVGRFKSGPF